MEDIDFVITWVDGSDPQWKAERQKYADSESGLMNKNDCRFRDWGTLRYWFRAIERYAPWVRTIHFVTSGQRPAWLNYEHPKLHFVKHEDFIPHKYLPTFNVNTIELNFHRIDGLADQFVYFNDDMFLAAPVRPEDFFDDGLPRHAAVRGLPSVNLELTHIILNDIQLINRHFNFRQQFWKYRWKWINYRYGLNVLRTLLLYPYGDFTGIRNEHLPNPFLKSTFEEVWEKCHERLDYTCRQKFRSYSDVNQYLMLYWQVVGGTFSPKGFCNDGCYLINETERLAHDLSSKRLKMICVNDPENVANISQLQQLVRSIFEREFPDRSSFEVGF